MGFWGGYLNALLHYWWTLVIVGVGGGFTYIWPFLPGSVHQLPSESGWAIAFGGVLLAQVLAARRLSLSAGGPNEAAQASAQPAIQFDQPSIGQTIGTSILYARNVVQNNTYVVSSPAPDAEIVVPGLADPADDEQPDQPAAPAEPPGPEH